MHRRPNTTLRALIALVTAALAWALVPATAGAADPNATCSPGVAIDTSIDSWTKYFGDGHNVNASPQLGSGNAGTAGGAAPGAAGPGRNLNSVLLEYADHLVAQTASSPRVRIVKKFIGNSALGRPIAFYVVGTPEHLATLDGPAGDAAFWRGVRAGDIPEADGMAAAVTRPAFGWITATPHGGESAAGESIARMLYELVARTDCQNIRRLTNMDLFLQLVRNPDGRDAVQRTTAWGFDPNRDFGTRNQVENAQFVPLMNEYPGLFFIDAHQQGGNGYFFPPNEDPVHHEISSFSLDTVQEKIGPALQQTFNDQSTLYQNYNQYDLFTPEYGDTVPSLIMGAAGMTYEKGNGEVYARQVYDHYLAIDETINVISNDKVGTTRAWVRQWNDSGADPENIDVNNPGFDLPFGAVDQGKRCALQPNKLKSPLHDSFTQIPTNTFVCGYFYRPDRHVGDVASLISNLQGVGVKVFRLNSSVTLNGVKNYGQPAATSTLPAGTLYIPMAQGMKHWIQAVLGENPYIPYPYYYDVVTWSYGMQRGLSGDGFLTDVSSLPTDMTQIAAPDLGGAPSGSATVFAFNTDSMQGLALAAELLDKGVNVYRGTTAFDAGGNHYYTGAALVDGPSLVTAGVDLNAMAKDRQTPVSALDRYPVSHQQMTKPKIGLYTGAATIPSDPLYLSGANVTAPAVQGHCALSAGGSAFCEALFTLRVKDEMPATTVVPVTSADIDADKLTSDGYTALINPGSTISNVTTAGKVQAFVNGGGRYVGYGAGGATTGRNAGLTNLNTNPVPSNMKTPGSTFDADVDVTDPVAWGFDLGTWIYRQSNDPMFDPATLPAGANPASTAPITYAANQGDGQKYGLAVNAVNSVLNSGRLNSRPAVVVSHLGAGVSTVLGFNPFFRAWKENDERIVLNAAMYPTTVVEAPTVASQGMSGSLAAGEAAPTAKTTVTVVKPLAKAKLPKVKAGKTIKRHDASKDLVIVVKSSAAAKLKRAVTKARLPKSIRGKVSIRTSKGKTTLTVRNVRGEDFHGREEWVNPLLGEIKRAKVRMLLAQL